jgi:3-hydroxypropanoate dehydrogenase
MQPEAATKSLDDAGLKLLFSEARTHGAWTSAPVSDELLHRLYALARMGPTSANLQPMRVVFVKSPEAKQKLRPTLSPGNLEKTMQAPVTAILAFDLAFFEHAPALFPARGADMKAMFASLPAAAVERTALVSASLQAGYLILAARALGLDCGPMGGFDAAKVDEAFFKGTSWRANILVNLGHGEPSKLFPRNPRHEFADACRIE